jgi:hypothetical protein
MNGSKNLEIFFVVVKYFNFNFVNLQNVSNIITAVAMI